MQFAIAFTRFGSILLTSKAMNGGSTFFNTEHRELGAFAFELLKKRDRNWPANYHLTLSVYQWSRMSAQNHSELLDYLYDRGSRSDFPIFEEWRRNQVDLTQHEVSFLLSSPSLWTRVLTFNLYPAKCPTETKGVMEKEVQSLLDSNSRSAKPKPEKDTFETELRQIQQLIGIGAK